jgi:hypothetical protein
LFALIGALLVAGGAWLLVEGALRLQRTVDGGVFSVRVWESEFWLYRPTKPGIGLSENAHWFLRLTGGIAAVIIGGKVLRTATR